METNELLLHLTKKLESGEIKMIFGKNSFEYWLVDTKKPNNMIKIAEVDEGIMGNLLPNLKSYSALFNGGIDWNKEFKENFYKEKGIKCWVKDCENKVLVEKGDHEKLKLQCQEKHTRMVCKPCSETDYIRQLM